MKSKQIADLAEQYADRVKVEPRNDWGIARASYIAGALTLTEEIKELKAENERLREALEGVQSLVYEAMPTGDNLTAWDFVKAFKQLYEDVCALTQNKEKR